MVEIWEYRRVNDHPESLAAQAVQLQRGGHLSDAILAYQRLLSRWPERAESWFNLAYLQRQTRQFPQALESYQKALDAGISGAEEVHLNRGVIYTDYLGQHAAAERELQRALSLNPVYLPALLNYATLCEDLGRRPEAAALYRRILALDPPSFEGLARYANLLMPEEAAALVSPLRRALANAAASAADRASLGFALGRVLDGIGDFRGAFAAYAEANRESRRSAGAGFTAYDPGIHRAFIDRLIACDPPPAAARADSRRPRPLFICGMFRSGSTLTEQLLAANPSIAAGGELDFLPRLVAGELAPYPESMTRLSASRCGEIAARYRAELARIAADAGYVTDKRPDNFLHIGLIKRLFPDARIVHTTRNALDNCLSIYFLHLDQSMSYALDLGDIGHYYLEYRRLMAHWQRLYPEDIFELNYDALVAAPQTELRRLFDFLQLEWDGRIPTPAPVGRSIKTASVWQVREPIHGRSSGRSSNYAGELEELRRLLGASA